MSTIAPMPPMSDSAAFRAWVRHEYPKHVARWRDEEPGQPRTEWNTDNRAEVAQRKRELATMAFENACRLMREADAIDEALMKDAAA